MIFPLFSIKSKKYIKCFSLIMLACLFFSVTNTKAQEEIMLSTGQTVYVPVYSHIYIGDNERPFNLTSTVSIRNTDPENKITITEVNYYGSDGKLLKKYIDEPVTLMGFAATRYVVRESDTAGGSGANFIVKWKSDKDANIPVIESINVSARSQQGISFTSPGKVIKDSSE